MCGSFSVKAVDEDKVTMNAKHIGTVRASIRDLHQRIWQTDILFQDENGWIKDGQRVRGITVSDLVELI